MRYIKQLPAKNEDGLVAMLVVAIMIILLSLTTVAFTKLMGREARQALDRQLSTQAYYAAASGINDAKDYLSKFPGGLLASSDCSVLPSQGYPAFLGPDSTSDVNKVTCVVGDTTPEQLYFHISAGQSQIFEMSSVTGFFEGVLFSWQNALANAYNPADYKAAGATGFTTNAAWNNRPTTAPVLEVTFYPMPTGAPQGLTTLLSQGRTIFLYPSQAPLGTAPTYKATNTPDGKIVGPSCQQNIDIHTIFDGATAVNHCNAIVIPVLTPALAGQNDPKYIFVKVSAFYGDASLIVRAISDLPNDKKAVNIGHAQAVLDSTGKGGADVLKRLQTIVDYRPTGIEPGDTLETAIGLCKRLEYNLTLNSAQVDSSADIAVDPATNTACHTTDHPGQPDPL